MSEVTDRPYRQLLLAHQERQAAAKNSEKTRDKLLAALERAVDVALQALGNPEELGPKEHKEALALLMKAAEQLAQFAPARAKPFHPTATDQTLLELYVQQRCAGIIPATLSAEPE